jgi:NADH:ubiquinone oxidoreductase subunit K
VSIGLLPVFLVAAGLVAIGVFAAAYRRDFGAALVSLPLLGSGTALAMAAATRFGARLSDPMSGQEFAIVIMIATLAGVLLGVGLLGREANR